MSAPPRGSSQQTRRRSSTPSRRASRARGRSSRAEPLAAVEDLLAEVLEPERGVVWAACRRLCDAGLDDLADEHGMVALLYRADQAALDEGRRVLQDRRAGRARAE